VIIHDNNPILRNVEPQDAAALVALARETLHSQWTEEFVRWKYFQNPAGAIYGSCVELEGQVVGFYGNAPLRIQVGDTIVAGAQALDAMVAPPARRHGLFVKMGNWVHERMTEAGVALSYGIPNPISRAGLVKRMGWDYPGEIPRFTRLLDPAAVIKNSDLPTIKAIPYLTALRLLSWLKTPPTTPLPHNLRVQEINAFDERFDMLWQQASATFPVAVKRDRPYLDWRYRQNPLMRYTILAAQENEQLRGYAILSHRDEAKGVMAIAELLVLPGDEAAGLGLLTAVAQYAQQANTSQIQCWMLPNHSFYVRLLEQSGYVYSTKRFFPGILRYTTSLIVKLPSEKKPVIDPRQMNNWYMTMGDQDYY
jgi:hypothetical protein